MNKFGEELYKKSLDKQPISVSELVDEKCKIYERGLKKCVDRGIEAFKSDFYINVRDIVNKVLRSHEDYFFQARRTLPFPVPNQDVYICSKEGDVRLLWSLPDENLFEYYTTSIFSNNSPEHEIAENIRKYRSGKLRHEFMRILDKELKE